MPESPKPSINSWLEDELYHQYLHDRQTVDADWKQMFDSNGHAIPANGKTVTARWPRKRQLPRASTPTAPRRRTGSPARPRAAHRREHDGQPDHAGRHQPARDAGEGDRRESAPDQRAPPAGGQEQDFLYAHCCLGHRQGGRKSSRAQSGLFGKRRREFPHHASEPEPGNRGRCRGQGWRAIAESAVDQGRAGDGFRAISGRL